MKRFLFGSDESGDSRSSRRSRSARTFGPRVFGLGLAFSVLVALLIGVGNFGLRRMDQVDHEMQAVVGRDCAKLKMARQATTYSSRNSLIMMQIFLLRNRKQIDSLRASQAQNTSMISSLLSEMEKQSDSERETESLAAIRQARQVYIESYRRALHLLLEENNRDAALVVTTDQSNPALLRYQIAWENFALFQEEQLARAAQGSRARYANARRFALSMIVLAMFMAAGSAAMVILRMLWESTHRLRHEKEALQAAHGEAEVFINAVPSILIGIDHEARITRWNLSATTAFNLPRSDVVGKPLADCGVTWLQPGLREEIHTWCSEGASRRCDRVSFEMNGETRLLGLTITPVRVTNENVSELLVIGSDITHRTMLEDQLRQAQKLESVGHLAAGIAHEINTPTQYIGDNVRFLKDGFGDLKKLLSHYERLLAAAKANALSSEILREVAAEVDHSDAAYLLEEIPKAIEQTIEGVTRVSTLVSAMKEFSHPGTKEKILLDLNHAIQSTLTVARNEWKYVAEMETDFDPALPLVCCQPGEFNQVILNLVVNAAHAIADVVGQGGSEKGKIRVQTRSCPDGVEIRIQDSGTGIPEKAQSRIFDPFFTTKEIGKGTGQGLAIARSVVVDKHGGAIHFETEDGKGTTFVIHLPREGSAAAAKAVSA